MPNKSNPLLKLAFAEMAQIGIGLPHHGYEVPLMLAGKKPCLIGSWPLRAQGEDFTQLEPLIQSGQLVMIGSIDFVGSEHIFCLAADIEAVQAAAIIEKKRWAREPVTREEFERHHAFLETYSGITFRDAEEKFDPSIFNERSKNSQEDCGLLLNGQIRATLPIITGTEFKNCPSQIKEKLENGTFCAVHMRTETIGLAVISQKDCVDMGRELFARYWHQGQGYEPLSDVDSIKRIGHLLGYMPQDTEFFLTTGSKPPAEHTEEERNIIESFEMVRRARAEYLLSDAPKPL